MYVNFRNVSVAFDAERGAFQCLYTPEGEQQELAFLREAQIWLSVDGERRELANFRNKQCWQGGCNYSDAPDGTPDASVSFRLSGGCVAVEIMSRAQIHAVGFFCWGGEPARSTFAVRLNSEERVLRSACGPAVAACDNALFDRNADRALEFDSAGDFAVRFDWTRGLYRFDYSAGVDFGREFSFRIHEHYCRDKFHIPYAPIRKTHGFETPPAGWMSWYALMFDTCESTVRANAEALAARLGPWARQNELCVWVDWEWSRRSWDALGIPGVDAFTPRTDAYPNGLASVAAAIRALGLVPALWLAPSNDGQMTRSLAEHPEWLLGEKKEWCGRYWLDPTHPGVLRDFIPAVFRNALDWGFAMFKWDAIPTTLAVCDEFHDRLHDAAISTEAAVRGMVQAARDAVGPDAYLLSCAGDADREVGFAMDLFSAARIGGDVFAWEKFIESALHRLYHCYAWHNTALYADADNLVLREEFNTPAQARSRAAFVGLAGLPVTIGDDLRDLPEERCDLLRRLLPTADIHPMELSHKRCGDTVSIQHLRVCRDFGDWSVVGVTNLGRAPLRTTLSLKRDLHLASGAHAIYDYWQRKYLGIRGDALSLEIAPFDTALLRVTPLAGHPVIIHTSRHITQGAIELADVHWDADARALSGIALATVPGEDWIMTLHLPSAYAFAGIDAPEETRPATAVDGDGNNDGDGKILSVVFHPQSADPIPWTLHFNANA